MNIRLLAAAAAFASPLVTGAAQAQDADGRQNFTGPRVEVTAGWNQLQFDLSRYSIAGSSKRSGISWGAEAGYDVPLGGNIVAGVETGVTFSNVDHGFSDGTTSYLMHARRDIEISGRLGAMIGQNALLYGKAGYTNFQLGSDATTAGVTTLQRTNLDGLRLGAGVELGLSKAAYLKTEYRYSNYQDGVSKNEVLTGFGIRF
jgi:outer membrane immunogenic protein